MEMTQSAFVVLLVLLVLLKFHPSIKAGNLKALDINVPIERKPIILVQSIREDMTTFKASPAPSCSW